jgi:hypothetical protein
MEPETYTLRKGTILYRGDTPFYLKNKDVDTKSLMLEPNKPIFFALSTDDVEQYGIIYGWEVPNDIVLPLIDNLEVMRNIYNNANKRPDVQTVLIENYGFDPKTGTVGIRKSYFEKDIIFYRYLCEKGYSGYASNDLEEGGRFTYEFMICNTIGFKPLGIVKPTDVGDMDLYIDNQIQKYKELINPKDTFGRKKRRVLTQAKGKNLFESPVNKSLFESPVKKNLFESPVNKSLFESPVNKNLFESPVNKNLFESPVNKNLFESPVNNNRVQYSMRKGGSKSKRKSVKCGKTRKTKVHQLRRLKFNSKYL